MTRPDFGSAAEARAGARTDGGWCRGGCGRCAGSRPRGVARRQPKTAATAAGGGALARARPRLYGRRSVVKASFRRNRGKGGWVRHARYLAREHAQREHGRGLGFDAGRERLDMAAVVREWERGDQLMWSLIISPEDAERHRSAPARARPGGRDGARPRHAAGVGRDRSSQHRRRARPSAHPRRARRWPDPDARPRLRAARHPRTEPGTDRTRAWAALGTRGPARARTRPSNASNGPRSTARWSGGRGSIGWSATRTSSPTAKGARVRAEQEIERLAISRKTGTGAARRRTELGAFTGARTGAAPASARARHHQEPGARAAARTRRGTISDLER